MHCAETMKSPQAKQILASVLHTIYKRMKRRLFDWKEIFTNHISDREFVPRIYKDLFSLRKKRKPVNNEQYVQRHFLQEDVKMANKLMKRLSSSLVIRPLQIKTSLRNQDLLA